jgi:anti-anti-sigma regulatory factor
MSCSFCVRTALIGPDGDIAFYVYLAGEIDIAAEVALRAAAEDLPAAVTDLVMVDLAAVTFAGATLANFLVRLRIDLPDHGSLLLCRVTQPVRVVLEAAGVMEIAMICADLPRRLKRRRQAISGGCVSGDGSPCVTADVGR